MPHANLSPSTAYRWLACPGSPRLCAKVPKRPTSIYAQEGTAAHKFAERCLRQYESPFKFKGQKITNDDGSSFTVDQEMAEAVDEYIKFASKIAPLGLVSEGHVTRGIETKVQACDEVWGTADLLVYNMKKQTLDVADYKHGRGVVVAADNNPQAMSYGLGALLKLQSKNVPVAKVSMHIIQPRAEGETVKTFSLTPEKLMQWRASVLLPGIRATQDKNAPLRTGDHCRFCDALPVCPQQAGEAMALAKVEFAGNSLPVLPDPADLAPEQLVRIMELAEVISTWAGSVKAYAQERAEMGVPLPGYKLVAKRSVRAWVDEAEAAFSLELLLGEDAYNRKLLSPAQAEKALKAAGANPKEVLTALTLKPDTGLNLVPESDRRTAVVPAMLEDYMDSMDIFK